jgi:hypothetical protein
MTKETATNAAYRALERMLAERADGRLEEKEGTPGYPNRKLSLAATPEEQIRYEHFNTRWSDASDPIRQELGSLLHVQSEGRGLGRWHSLTGLCHIPKMES